MSAFDERPAVKEPTEYDSDSERGFWLDARSRVCYDEARLVRIHFLVHMHRHDAIEAARRTALMLKPKGAEVFVEPDAAKVTGLPEVSVEAFPNCDLVVSFGGDGTLIRAAQWVGSTGTPILGVYYGRFGFVTQCHPNEIGAAISQFLDGKARIEPRMMIQVQLLRAEREVATLHALNEAVVQRAATTRMLDFEVSVDTKFLTRYPADGILVSTPTGSTAYNLSAGGPIVDPRVDAMVLSALTPHTLSARSLIFNPDSTIEISIQTRGDAVLSCDGAFRLQMLSGDRVKVTRSPRITRLISVDDKDFLTKLSDRLLWSRELPEEDEDDE